MSKHVLTLTVEGSPLYLTRASCSCGAWQKSYSPRELELGVLDFPAMDHAEHVKDATPGPASGTMLSPDCRDAKHTSCNGTGYDLSRDQFADCPCPCHVRPR